MQKLAPNRILTSWADVRCFHYLDQLANLASTIHNLTIFISWTLNCPEISHGLGYFCQSISFRFIREKHSWWLIGSSRVQHSGAEVSLEVVLSPCLLTIHKKGKLTSRAAFPYAFFPSDLHAVHMAYLVCCDLIFSLGYVILHLHDGVSGRRKTEVDLITCMHRLSDCSWSSKVIWSQGRYNK